MRVATLPQSSNPPHHPSIHRYASPSTSPSSRNEDVDYCVGSSLQDESSCDCAPLTRRREGGRRRVTASGDYQCRLPRSARPPRKGGFDHYVVQCEVTQTQSHINPQTMNQGPSHLRELTAELVGTAILMQLGCMSSVTNGQKSATSAVMFGFIEATLIGVFNHISTAHLNPAVTITQYAIDNVGFASLLIRMFGELIGSIIGVGLMICMTPSDWLEPQVCTTRPHEGLTGLQAFTVEFACTSIYCLLVSSLNERSRTDSHGHLDESAFFKYASILMALSLACGQYTGSSMNPARSLGPAVWTGVWDAHWVYWLGPIAGAVAGPIFYNKLFSKRTNVGEINTITNRLN